MGLTAGRATKRNNKKCRRYWTGDNVRTGYAS